MRAPLGLPRLIPLTQLGGLLHVGRRRVAARVAALLPRVLHRRRPTVAFAGAVSVGRRVLATVTLRGGGSVGSAYKAAAAAGETI